MALKIKSIAVPFSFSLLLQLFLLLLTYLLYSYKALVWHMHSYRKVYKLNNSNRQVVRGCGGARRAIETEIVAELCEIDESVSVRGGGGGRGERADERGCSIFTLTHAHTSTHTHAHADSLQLQLQLHRLSETTMRGRQDDACNSPRQTRRATTHTTPQRDEPKIDEKC